MRFTSQHALYDQAICMSSQWICESTRPAADFNPFLTAGMVNSAAVYTHAWRGGNAMASLQDWAAALTKANSPNVHVNVVPAG